MPWVIRHVRELFEQGQGAELYCWSSGGSDYARQSAKECGIEECFRAFLYGFRLIPLRVPLRSSLHYTIRTVLFPMRTGPIGAALSKTPLRWKYRPLHYRYFRNSYYPNPKPSSTTKVFQTGVTCYTFTPTTATAKLCKTTNSEILTFLERNPDPPAAGSRS